MIQNPIYDLHSHTTASDGALSPEALIERAVANTIDTLAITDHDTVAAIPYAKKFIRENELPIELLTGVEISTHWLHHDIHIVGLNIDINNSSLIALLDEQIHKRQQRAKAIEAKLEKIEVIGSLNAIELSLLNSSPLPVRFTPMITRNHFAQHLYSIGKVNSHQKAFDKFLAKGKVGYVSANWCPMEIAIDVIHKAGGKAILAHPYAYPLKGKWTRRLVEAFKMMNGDAIEVTNSQLPPDRRSHFASLAREFDLFVSVGSDFHRQTPWSDLGRNLWLPADVRPIWSHF